MRAKGASSVAAFTKPARGHTPDAKVGRKVAGPVRVWCINGPNLGRLGKRQPALYGTTSYTNLVLDLQRAGKALGAEVSCFQSDHEGDLVRWIGEATDGAAEASVAGLLLNAAAYTHTSIAILDALLASPLPCVEVHLTQPGAREAFRRTSLVSRGAAAVVSGFGVQSYHLALQGLLGLLATKR
jgi:3-dehydroquinate dehydratase II